MKRLFALSMFISLACLSCFSAENLARVVRSVSSPPEVNLPWEPTSTHLPVVTPTFLPTMQPTPEGSCDPQYAEEYLVFAGDGGLTFELDLNCFDYLPVARIATSGATYFTITALDEDNNQLGVIMDDIGLYDAYVPLFMLDQIYQYVDVDTDGLWTIDIFPLEHIVESHILSQGFSYTGMGSDIVLLRGGPGKLKFSNSSREAFTVTAMSGEEFITLVDKNDPYDVEVEIEAKGYILFVTSRTPWDAEYR